jgi:hypothetical protein
MIKTLSMYFDIGIGVTQDLYYRTYEVTDDGDNFLLPKAANLIGISAMSLCYLQSNSAPVEHVAFFRLKNVLPTRPTLSNEIKVNWANAAEFTSDIICKANLGDLRIQPIPIEQFIGEIIFRCEGLASTATLELWVNLLFEDINL